MIRALGVATASVTLCLLIAPAADAADTCSATGGLEDAAAQCVHSGDEIKAIAHSDPNYRWTVKPVCKTESQGGTCFNPVVCGSGAGVLYAVYRIQLPSGPRELYGYACLTDQEAADLGAITPAMVFTAMQGLTWPTSELVVQPPGGETLVNLETNFYTTNVEPTTQTVTLLGQQVEIEATPGRYVWHWAGAGEADNAQDTGSMTSESPRAAYPNLAVTHTYRDAKITVHPWVDTVYSGRYRVNGDGWTPIPQTLTVPGEPVALRILEAHPVLVG